MAFITSLVLLAAPIVAIKIWETPAELGTGIPAGCRAALTTNITCPMRLVTAPEIVSEAPINSTWLAEYCTPECRDSVQSFANLVGTRCGDTVYSFGNSTEQSGNDIALPLLWAQNMACLEDSAQGALCLPEITDHAVEACDDCTLQYLAGMLNSTYGHQRVSEGSFSSLVSSCSAAPTDYPHGTVTFPPAPTSTSNSSAPCIGTAYTAVEGDTCESIADENGVSYYRLLSDNSLDLDCETLTVGMDLCIGDACTLYTVTANDTCNTILADKSYTLTELLAWNPILHSDCGNMASLSGHTICISPPGSGEWDIPITVTYTEIFTTPAGDWVTAPAATQAPNTTRTDPYALQPIGTLTATANMTAYSLSVAMATACPISEEDYERGFEWELLPFDCSEVMELYCEPDPDSPAPEETTFEPSCMPSVIMGW
ncbi:hypothetical protein BDW69DRAFT_190101 [Aspergillus filifer]